MTFRHESIRQAVAGYGSGSFLTRTSFAGIAGIRIAAGRGIRFGRAEWPIQKRFFVSSRSVQK